MKVVSRQVSGRNWVEFETNPWSPFRVHSSRSPEDSAHDIRSGISPLTSDLPEGASGQQEPNIPLALPAPTFILGLFSLLRTKKLSIQQVPRTHTSDKP